MEVLVPFGSSFVYRHIGAIDQAEWKIVAIYRNRKLILPDRRKMIQPNDLLVLIGEPIVLRSVYRAIKRELGQFPEPFGSNLYLYLDLNIVDANSMQDFITRAVYVHERFKNRLIIKVVNAGNIELIQYVKNLACEDITVNIEYDNSKLKESFFKDLKFYHIGLIIISEELLSNHSLRKMLYNAHTPVLKIAKKDFSSLRNISLIVGEDNNSEKISTTVFDIAQQMNLNIDLYNYKQEHQEQKKQVIEHYQSLSAIFSKSINILESNENSIKLLQEKENFIHIAPFTKKLTSRDIFSLLSTDSEKLYHKLDNYHQVFIPIQV